MNFKGADAKMSVVIGAMAVSDLVKSTLGPKGMVRARPSSPSRTVGRSDVATIVHRTRSSSRRRVT